jgi:hypothetical protein
MSIYYISHRNSPHLVHVVAVVVLVAVRMAVLVRMRACSLGRRSLTQEHNRPYHGALVISSTACMPNRASPTTKHAGVS